MINDLPGHLANMRAYFREGHTRSYAFRKQQLLALKKAIETQEQAIYDALYQDLRKSPEESWVTENGFLLSELNHTLKWLKAWMEPQHKPTNLLNLPSSSRVESEPLGVVLIIAPWNYPLQLLLTPLVGAIAAGNCVVLKPSEFAPATAALMQSIIEQTFPPEYICCIPGDGATVIPAMMEHYTFDHVLYTGSTAVGRIIYKMAAEKLVPVTLELGGKSPCVVEADANIQVAANRITVTKFSNAGQMCIAPDYILVHRSVKDKLVSAIRQKIEAFFGTDPQQSYEYGKIINAKQFNRLRNYLSQGTVLHGGNSQEETLYIEPCLLEVTDLQAPVMTEEIFGPVLPIIAYDSMEQAMEIIQRNPNPLAFYLFTGSTKKERAWLDQVPAGAACINNASWHATNHHLPFGGRGFSGSGRYHGKYSFDTFSHQKAVLKTPTWFDPAMKYPPFKGKLWLFKWFIR